MAACRRIRIPEIKRHAVDDLRRSEVTVARFVASQKVTPVGLWSARVSGKDRHEVRPMATVGQMEAAR